MIPFLNFAVAKANLAGMSQLHILNFVVRWDQNLRWGNEVVATALFLPCKSMYIAEYLPRLGNVSIRLRFKESVKDIIKLSITCNDGITNYLVVSTKLDTFTVKLPVKTPANDLKVTAVNLLLGLLSITVALPTKQRPDTLISEGSFMNLVDSSLQKWSIKDLLRKTPKNNDNVNVFSLACKACDSLIIDSTTVNKFIDMPSELWYEMMDFWHCHKPHDHHNHSHDEKNYNGNLKPGVNDVFIGSSYLLVNRQRGWNVNGQGSAVVCTNCSEKIGEVVEEDTWKLFKWNLKLKYGENTEIYPLYLVVYYFILEKINSTATRKFTISHDNDNLIIWVVNTGLSVTTETSELENCLKVLYYQSLESIIDDDNAEYLEVDRTIFDELHDKLKKINCELPESTRSLPLMQDSTVINREISYL